VFNWVTAGANICALFLPGRNRFIAASLVLIPIASELEDFSILHGHGSPQISLGFFQIDPFNLSFLIASVVLFAALGLRAWNAWRTRDELRVEFDSAREMQQLLVSPAADLPGFHMRSAYLPALHVGGDFFHVAQQQDGSVLVVVGDVSGKGLRAAMTVSAIMGALRTLPENPALSPAGLLSQLNRGLSGRLAGGFVTACAARIFPDGRLLLANAGHLVPYASGIELPADSGLPLGIIPDAAYSNTIFELAPDTCITFLSDGVIEARNKNGELFGFDRTAAISMQSADEIAKTAELFGQEDDITVLTLTFAPVEVLHA
jgi:serine phosphatase RsbU (regulator of sigma subunit)